ncbi:Phosphoinositide phospholipase C [Aphelenchoides besseyi]|nr:Phosphoinositide phospholipase C [Aphelenchoides besseyi]
MSKHSIEKSNGQDAQHRRGLYASSGHSTVNSHKSSVGSGSSLSALFMSSQSTGSTTSSRLSSARHGHHRHGPRNASGTYGNRGPGTRAQELDIEKVLLAMEKGHRVCKLLLLKKWEPTYKRLSFSRETRQIILSKNDPNIASINKLAKPQCLDLMLVKDVHTAGYKMNKMKIQDKWKKDKELQRFQADWILVISFGSSFVLNHWLFLFDGAEACRLWCQGLHYLRMELADASHFLIMERWLRKQFYNIVNPDSATVTIRHMKPFVQTTLQYKVQSRQLQEITEGEMGFEAFALAHKRLVNLNALFQQYFRHLSEDDQKVTFFNFYKFVNEHGYDFGQTREETSSFLRRYFRECDISRDVPEPSMSTDEFVDFLFSAENSIFDPVNTRVVHDMNRPLTHYWIASSHNTYLTGDQLKSESSLDAYSRALMMGCRCIELDCWDGQKKSNGEFAEIVIYHGYTMTSKLNLRDVLYTIKHYAFQTSDFPVILSIEDNCSVPAQRLMAQEIKEILGDLLLTTPVSRDEIQLPSPASLRHKIILKHKKLQLENEGLNLSGNDEENDSDILSKECTKRGVLYLRDDATGHWHKHVFVLFEDRLCYISDTVEDETTSIKEDTLSQIGDDDISEESTPTGFGVRPEEMHVTEEWFHGRVNREVAKERLLEQISKGNGVYLVRESGTFIGDYTLSFLHDKLVHHCRIKTAMINGEKKYFFLENNKKDTLYELISYYTKHTLDTPAFRSYLITPCPQPQPHLNEPWFDEKADKKRAEELLNTVKDNGAFLIRYSSTDPNVFVLSLRVDGEFWHYRLKRDGRIFVVNQTVFENLNQIVDYYSSRDFIRGICLKLPVNEKTVGVYSTGELSSTQAGYYMELKDLEKEIEAVAIKDFDGTSPDDLSFQIGTRLSIVRKDPDLWKGRCDGRVGWFPPDFVKEIDSDVTDEMKYTTIELAGSIIDKTDSDHPHAFRITQSTSHWEVKEVIIAAETREEMDDWLNTLHSLTRTVNDKITLLRSKEKQLRIANELSSLVVYCQAVPFNPDFALQDPKTTFYEMCSFSETKHEKLLEKGLTLFNARQLSRVYPQASRLTSTNFYPVPYWNSGCHMVALNYQTGDRSMQLNDAKFLANGRCGYVLKPLYLMDETFRPDLANDSPCANSCPIVLTVQVIAGKHLSRKDHNKASNGLNPHWNETFVFQIYRPELAILRFTVEDGDFVGPKTDPFIGQAGFPVDCIRPGYRSVPLLNQFSEPFEVSSLLVYVEIKPMIEEEERVPSAMTPEQFHAQLQAGRSTYKGKKKMLKDGGSQSSTEAVATRPIPRLSLDGENITETPPRAIDRKISLNQSLDSNSNSPIISPRSPGSVATLSAMTIESRSTSMESEESAQSSNHTTKKGGLKKFFRFGK